MPPECFGSSAAASSPALDIWAIGITFYALLYGTLPFVDMKDRSEKKMQARIIKGTFPFPAEVPVTDMAKHVIQRMLEKSPDSRIGLLEFMDLPYYSMHDDELSRFYNEKVEARKIIDDALEAKRDEERKLAEQFSATLTTSWWPGANRSAATHGRRGNTMSSPHRAMKKKKSGIKAAATASTPSEGSAASSSTSA